MANLPSWPQVQGDFAENGDGPGRLSSLYRREIGAPYQLRNLRKAYYNIGLMGEAGPGSDREKNHRFRDL
jgi:hypothetical protein